MSNNHSPAGREGSIETLVASFLPYIRSRAARIRSVGLDGDDSVQEGLIGLLRAFDTYDEAGGASFSTYAITCIDNGISSALRRTSREKDQPLNSSVPLSDDLPGFVRSPEDLAIRRVELEKLAERVRQDLTDLERKVLGLYLEGYSYHAMAEKLNATEKTVDNALQRARRKLK